LEVPSGKMDLQYHEQAVKEDIRDITGFNEYLRGSAVPRTKTAYETQRIEAGSSIRIADLNDYVEKHCSRVAKKLLAIATEFVSATDMLQVVGLPIDLRMLGLPFNVPITPEVLKLDCQVTIHTGSMTLPNKAMDQPKALMLLQLLQFPEVNRAEQLSEIYELLELDARRFLLPQQNVPPEEVQMSKLALMGGGKTREMGGGETGTLFGARQRPEMMVPGGF